MSGTLHRDIAFEMATDADRIATLRIKICRIHDCGFAAAMHMSLRISVTGLAGNAAVQKWQSTVSIDGSGIASLDRAHMAPQTTALHRQRGRHLCHLRQARLHIVAVRCGILGNRRFKEIVLEFE